MLLRVPVSILISTTRCLYVCVRTRSLVHITLVGLKTNFCGLCGACARVYQVESSYDNTEPVALWYRRIMENAGRRC